MWPPKLQPSRSIGRRVMAFRIFSNNDRPPFWILKILIFDHVLSLLSEFAVVYQISSKLVHAFGLQTPITDDVQCAVARQRPSPWQPQHGGHVGNMMGCDQPSCIPVGSLVGELWHFEYFPTWRPSAILNFYIWSRDCHCGPNLLLYTKFQQNSFTRSASRRP